ncbi:MAG: hypothetical protein LBQ97_09680 [Fusobacteriaceae bacterium]|jgi:enamine deaminase RidA (YjgF/YER057c/UK114 family)|nr:hypothetical protein [Fusobacteriaceae bacterium]
MKLIIPPSKRKNQGHYSPGVIAGNLLFISGQLSVDPDTGSFFRFLMIPGGKLRWAKE